MKKLKYILKGVLLYSTLFIFVFYAISIDSITEKGLGIFLISSLIVLILIFLCLGIIPLEEIKKLLRYK